MQNEKKNKILDGKKYYSLYQVLVAFTRVNRFNLKMIPPRLLEKLKTETYVDPNGQIQKMFIYPTPVGISKRPFLSIYQEAIPTFLTKWGQFFGVPSHIISKSQQIEDLKTADSSLLLIDDFCKLISLPLSASHWINNNAFSPFLNQDKENPFFIYALDEFMLKKLYIRKDSIKDFILQNQEILSLFGLSKNAIDYIKKTPLNFSDKNYKLIKEDDIIRPHFRLDEVAKALQKTTVFIPILKEFIIKNCLKDTFILELEGDKKIELPLFSYHIGFNNKRESCYLFKQGLRTFVKRYQYDLLKLGIKQKTIHALLQSKEKSSDSNEQLLNFFDAYFLVLPNVSFQKFRDTLLKEKDTPLQELVTNTKATNEPAIIYVNNTLRDPYFIYQSALVPLLKKNASALEISNMQLLRSQLLIENTYQSAIPTSYFLKNIGISSKFKKAFNQLILKPNKTILLPFVDTDNKTKYIIPFGVYKDKSGNRMLGVYLNATAHIINYFKKEFIQMGVSKEHLSHLKKHLSHFYPLAQKLTSQKRTIPHRENKREYDDI